MVLGLPGIVAASLMSAIAVQAKRDIKRVAASTHQQSYNPALVKAAHQLAELFDGLYILVIDREDHVPTTQTGAGCSPLHIVHKHAALDLQFFADQIPF